MKTIHKTTTLLQRLETASRLMQLDLACREEVAATIPASPHAALEIAEQLGVDPRWLATGEHSPAGEAAAKILIDSGFSADDEAIETVLMTPQPEGFPGVCRYCGCTDEMGCGDCTWVDEACTICSACLQEVQP